jgi:hypothetical protein
LSPNRLLKLLLPAVDAVEFRPLAPLGGVGGAASSDRALKEPMVDERPRMPRRMGPPLCGDERAEVMDFCESFRNKEPAPGEARFTAAAARATCDEEGTGGVCAPDPSWWRRRAVSGGLPVGEWCGEPELRPPVETRGVAGAVSGNCGGSIFIGRGNNDARCFRRPKVKRAEPFRGGCCGRGVFSKETWPPELPSEREDCDARGSGRDRVMLLSTDSRGSARTSGRCWLLVDKRSFSSIRLPWLFLNPSGPFFLSVDLRRMPGRSPMVGSKDRRRRLNCCSLPRFFGVVWSASGSDSMTVGAVVMIAGAAQGHTSAFGTQFRTARRTLWVRRHRRHGRGALAVSRSMLLGLDGQLRIGGMAEAHQAEAPRVGRGFLDGRRGGFVTVRGERRARDVGLAGAAAIFRDSQAVHVQVLCRLVVARVPVAALEEVGGIEGAAALQVSFASAWSEGPQRHCCARG